MPRQSSCFHCGLPVPPGSDWRLEVLGRERHYCCPGCREVSRAIVEAGLEDYYAHRDTPAERADPDLVPDFLRRLPLYDHPDIQKSFVRSDGEVREAALILENIRCAACLWLNEQHLRRTPGVLDVEMDYASQRARVRWDPARTRLSEILRAIAAIGYVAHPYDPSHREALLEGRKRRDAQRLLFAGIVGMPVMQFSLASYLVGVAVSGRLEVWEQVGRWSTLLAVTGVLAYSAQDFFVGAWRDLRARRLGMDVPIVLGLSMAWLGSLVATWSGQGHVYVDSIAMFVFFVLLARVYEMRGRVAAADAMDRLAKVVPRTARRLGPEGREEEVPTVELSAGDRLALRPGEVVAVDGVVVEGRSRFDESLLTGESAPVTRGPGEPVVAGSCNREQPVIVEVTRVGVSSTVGEINHLLDQGQRARPRYALLAERAAEWFVGLVLVIAATTAAVWLWLDPEAALANTVSVLIVTCPCALALATPVALAVSGGRFAEAGVLPLRMAGLEPLAGAEVAVLDKTGTLTLGELAVIRVEPLGLEAQTALSYAAALEAGSEHPVAQAFRERVPEPGARAEGRANHPGSGVEGRIGGRVWRLGRPAFVLGGRAPDAALARRIAEREAAGEQAVLIGDGREVGALFGLRDAPRPGLEGLVPALRAAGLRRVAILSGDASGPVRRLGEALGVDEARGDLRPEDKLAWIRARQSEGRRVLMVGDGINDAPTLAAADASVSFAEATDLAQLHSDFIVLHQDLGVLPAARALARRARGIIRANLAWAASYNLLAVPAAAAGLVPPWAAAIGMSVSSLVVVANALRLRRKAPRESSGPLAGARPGPVSSVPGSGEGRGGIGERLEA